MDINESKIKFYTMDGKKIDDIEIKNSPNLDTEKEIKISSGFKKALQTVTEKDIKILSNKLNKNIKDINNCLVTILDANEMPNLSDEIENINGIVDDIEDLTSKLIIKKNNIKVGLFSSNKKEKKNKVKKIEDSINYLSKCQNDIISIKNEYNKLLNRNEGLKAIEFEEERVKEDCVDPLERTINFYMTKEN